MPQQPIKMLAWLKLSPPPLSLIFFYVMPIVYIIAPQKTFPACIAMHLTAMVDVTKKTFRGSGMIVFEVKFESLRHENALLAISRACPGARIVCARRPIFMGLTPRDKPVWSVKLSEDKDVLFSAWNDENGTWEPSVPQPVMTTVCFNAFYTKLKCQEDGDNFLYVETDAKGYPLADASNCVMTHTGVKRNLSALCVGPEKKKKKLCVGDHIAYLLPHVAVEMQSSFITTKIVGFDMSRPCFVKLENNHHLNILESGNVHVARYCPVTQRVQFPVACLKDFQ